MMTDETPFHDTDSYLLNPMHPVTVNVIGVGGTGSSVLTLLARLNEGLLGLGHPGIFVTAFDPDDVSDANIGRQLFSPADLGANKAVTLVSRVNRHFGNNWRAVPEIYDRKFIAKRQMQIPVANITISCVDTLAARREIRQTLKRSFRKEHVEDFLQPHSRPLYWLDFGNSQTSGQFILSTVEQARSQSDSVKSLPDLFTMFPKMLTSPEDVSTPSCSRQEALEKQDLFVNSIIANHGINLLWKMFREIRIKYHGMFINLDTMKTNPIPVKRKDTVSKVAA